MHRTTWMLGRKGLDYFQVLLSLFRWNCYKLKWEARPVNRSELFGGVPWVSRSPGSAKKSSEDDQTLLGKMEVGEIFRKHPGRVWSRIGSYQKVMIYVRSDIIHRYLQRVTGSTELLIWWIRHIIGSIGFAACLPMDDKVPAQGTFSKKFLDRKHQAIPCHQIFQRLIRLKSSCPWAVETLRIFKHGAFFVRGGPVCT